MTEPEPTNADIKKDTEDLVAGVHENPSNADLMIAVNKHGENLKEHAAQDFEVAKKQAKVNEENQESLSAIHKKLKDIPNKEENALIVEAVIKKMLLSKGKVVYSFTLGVAALVVAIVAIGGGFKVILGWLGFAFLK